MSIWAFLQGKSLAALRLDSLKKHCNVKIEVQVIRPLGVPARLGSITIVAWSVGIVFVSSTLLASVLRMISIWASLHAKSLVIPLFANKGKAVL